MNYTDTYVLDGIQDLIDSADNTGCSEDLTVVSRATVQHLEDMLQFASGCNAKARDLKYLAKTALETQDAANPRPVAVLLCDAIFTVMQNGGNPAFEESPLCRVILNTLLNLMKYRSLPHYDEDVQLYSRDIEELEKLAGQKEQPCPSTV